MGYEGGDLLLTGVAWPTVSFAAQACVPVAWLAGGSGQWRELIRGDDVLYKLTFFTFLK